MKKLLTILLIGAISIGLVACGKANTATPNTVGGMYVAAFDASKNNTAADIAAELADLEGMVTMDMQPGYLDGFTEDITDFTACTKFSPMIGSIPFAGYVFETDNPDALLKQLQGCADPGWNICTRADETVYSTKGNLVFFLMCSNE